MRKLPRSRTPGSIPGPAVGPPPDRIVVSEVEGRTVTFWVRANSPDVRVDDPARPGPRELGLFVAAYRYPAARDVLIEAFAELRLNPPKGEAPCPENPSPSSAT